MQQQNSIVMMTSLDSKLGQVLVTVVGNLRQLMKFGVWRRRRPPSIFQWPVAAFSREIHVILGMIKPGLTLILIVLGQKSL